MKSYGYKMVDTKEQRLDIIKYCNLLLNGYLSHFKQTDDSPQGRMITQLKCLKEVEKNLNRCLNIFFKLNIDLSYQSEPC